MGGRCEALEQINEVSFMLNDLSLYLDTHPTDKEALGWFGKYSAERKNLLKKFEENYNPLTIDCVCTEHPEKEPHFTWVDGPLPWDCQEGGRAHVEL